MTEAKVNPDAEADLETRIRETILRVFPHLTATDIRHQRTFLLAFGSRLARSATAASKRISVSSSGEMDWITATPVYWAGQSRRCAKLYFKEKAMHL